MKLQHGLMIDGPNVWTYYDRVKGGWRKLPPLPPAPTAEQSYRAYVELVREGSLFPLRIEGE